jgi:hypothetical protein
VVLWPEEMIVQEKHRLRRTGVAAVVLYFAPIVAVAALRGRSPWEIPHFHIAIPIVLICLLPVAYFLMPMFDGVLVFGSARPTTARAALFVRCAIADAIAVLSFYLFIHSGELMWPVIYWALGLPAALGILRRIGAYQSAMERIATGQAAKQ